VTATVRKLIQAGSILPPLDLTGGDGSRAVLIPSSQALLLVFAHPGPCSRCASYLDEISGAVDDLRSWGTRPIGVLPDGEDPAPGPFPVLRDEGDEGRRRLGIGADEAAVLLTDRWGEVFEVAAYGRDHDLPLPRQLIESAKIVDLTCGECNVPGPEWRETPT